MNFLNLTKMALVSLTLMATVAAKAERQAIPENMLAQYGQGASIAALNLGNCGDAQTGQYLGTYSELTRVQQTVGAPDAGFVDNVVNQPALILIKYFDQNQHRIYVEITTSADGKSLSKLRYYNQTFENVNKGTLLAPTIVKEYVTTRVTNCFAQK